MVRITKTMQEKHLETLSPYVKEFRNTACSTPLPLLPKYLATFPTRWPFPKGDLYHWVSLLNRFDVILERFCKVYKLAEGPQTIDFACIMLENTTGVSEEDAAIHKDLPALGFGPDGDRQLVEAVLNFSRVLLERCGNRAVYASSEHLSSLLNTTSLSLLEATLQLGSQCAQRYFSALKRNNIQNTRSASPALLTSHYNIDLNRVLQLALPFSKTVHTPAEALQPLTPTPTTPTVKGKEKASFVTPTSHKGLNTTVYASDLVSLVKGGPGVGSTSRPLSNGTDAASSPMSDLSWEQWGDVQISYYPKTATDTELPNNTSRPPNPTPSPLPPVTPAPIRRSSNLGPNAQRVTRISTSDDSPTPTRSSTFAVDETPRQNSKTIDIPLTRIKSTGIHTLLKEHATGLNKELQYELLTKLRAANALTSSLDSRRQILAIRILAITNLAYTYSETTFHDKVMKQDGDEPKRLQLAFQLADLIHPPAEGDVAVPRPLQTIAFAALEALSQHPSKFHDVCKALNTTINHGVLLYVIRKAVAGMTAEDSGDRTTEEDEWREALFSLVSTISAVPRTSEGLVTAGLIPILVEILTMRSSLAGRYQPKILTYLDTSVYSAREAFQALIGANGLDAVSDLIVYETRSAAENAATGKGMPIERRSPVVDYEIPYFQQQTLKWLFKFIHHMMSSANSYGGNFDRLLRNLIDSPQLLGSLHQIIGNSSCFGSMVWSNAVGILNGFINNEPTSFAVIAEAGLSRGFLEAVTGTPIVMPSSPKPKASEVPPAELADASSKPPSVSSPSDDEDDSDTDDDDEDEAPKIHAPRLRSINNTRGGKLARGILPTSETINIVPQAFSALCLNNAGMKMFRASQALETFFEIFESPEHVKCMDIHKDLPANLGATFDELVRHHPPLKTAILNAILDMVARVWHLCKTKAERSHAGARLLTFDSAGKVVIADERLHTASLSNGKGKAVDNGSDVEMHDVESVNGDGQSGASVPEDASVTSMTPYISCVATFLSAIFSNASVRSEFSANGGIEYLLDLAESPCLPYNFADSHTSRTLQNVISLLAEQKPHLLFPSLLHRAQSAADVLAPFADHTGTTAYFAPFINNEARESASQDFIANGTAFVKSLVNINSLVATLHACFHATPYSHRNQTPAFNQVNIADYYIRLVQFLGPLLGASIKEEIKHQKLVPDEWKEFKNKDTTVKADSVADTLRAFSPRAEVLILDDEEPDVELVTPNGEEAEVEASSSIGGVLPASETASTVSPTPKKSKSQAQLELSSPEFKNFQALRQLLSKVARTVSPFFQTLGKALVAKRNLDMYQKQTHTAIAEALADTMLKQLAPSEDESKFENYAFWVGMIDVLKDMLLEINRHTAERPVQVITIVLQAFKDRGGFTTLNHILDVFASEVQLSNLEAESPSDEKTDQLVKFALATDGVKKILSLYAHIVHGKNIADSAQTASMVPRDRESRDRSGARPAEQFSPAQFIVELRMAILPNVRRLWESDLIDKAASQISEKIIEVLRTIAEADNENGAYKRSDAIGPVAKTTRKTLKFNQGAVESLVESGFDADLAKEALFRCNNMLASAMEYCRDQKEERSHARNPIPEGEIATTPEPSSTSGPPTASPGTATPDDHAMAVDSHPSVESIVNGLNQQVVAPQAAGSEPVTLQNLDQLLTHVMNTYNESSGGPSRTTSAPVEQTPVADEVQVKPVTIDDLNDERGLIRDQLIDKCLDVINAHGEVTFEVADLITTMVKKSGDPTTLRKGIAETLVIALMSFGGEDDLQKVGNKVAAYAHLLALMLREKSFYTAAVGDLKENLGTLLSFIKLSTKHSPGEPSPWIAQILLIVEMLLSEDARPVKTKWNTPKDENDKIETPVLESVEFAVSEEERGQLLEAILDILPRIGKEESLALSVLRILVILTRTRSIAQAMGEKKNIQRLFVMAKQLAGASSTRIQSPMLLILRHIIEDEETIKQVMRSDIKSYFESPSRPTRHLDTITYLRGLGHNAIRAPQFFVEITNEMVQFQKWSFSGDGPPRQHVLIMKNRASTAPKKSVDDSVQPTVQATEDLTLQDIKPSTETVDREMPDASKPTAPEQKLPVVENPDGVIHFLLCELMNYKDVEDKDPSQPPANLADKAVSPSGDDVVMSGTTPPSAAEESATKSAKTSKPTKQQFKSEEHPIYIYRCFLLQCLTELLASYNRTKIEFINFKRSAPPQAMTPSKPRSSVVNYLLFDLIPLGTLEHAESTILRKKLTTSSWADSVLTALLSKTGEQIVDRSREESDGEEEPDLLFVRRFVLENVLKAYKDASVSNESLDIKYARMLALAELMGHIMSGKDNLSDTDPEVSRRSQLQLRRIMFEKGFIAALTASVADIDLNYPGAKRAVKYILRPLRVLTTTAATLSEKALISNIPGQTDDDEIESASSVSDLEDAREETPDLFRNSTLGMFEQGDGEDTSSDSDDDDEDMEYDEYDGEMEYEEEMVEDDEDNVSDEDEDIEGIGPIEGLSGDHGVVEVIMEEHDDDDDDDDDSSGDSDDDDGESEDVDDDDARVEIIEEVEENMNEGEDQGDWSDVDNEAEEDYEDQAAEAEEAHIHAHAHTHAMDDGPLGHLVRALGSAEGAVEILQRMEDDGVDVEDDEHLADYMDEDDDDEDDDEEDMDEEMLFEQAFHPGPIAFGWEGEDAPPPRGQHGRPPRHMFPHAFPFISGGSRDPLGVPDFRQYRSHRGPPPARSADDGTNPLLQRATGQNRDAANRPPPVGSWIQAIGPGGNILDMGMGGRPFGDSPAALLEVIRALQHPGLTRHGASLQFHITTSPGQAIPRELEAMIAPTRSSRPDNRRDTTEPGSAVLFSPQSTTQRWSEEARLLFGMNNVEKALDLNNAILSVLIPPAIEEEAKRQKQLEEEKKRREQEEKERREQAAKEAEIKAAKEKQEAEEREAAEKAAAEAAAAEAAAAAAAARGTENEESAEGQSSERGESIAEAMDGVESNAPEPAAPPAEEEAPAGDRPRVTCIIRGNPYDITDLGIDADFLAELPEEIREEVIMNAVAERRSQAAATGAQPSDIDQEFLDALPEDIRDEIIQQERQDRRRREREEARRAQAAAGGGIPQPDREMDLPSILATFSPALRQEVLMDGDEELLAQLPADLAAQARAMRRETPRMAVGLARRSAPGNDDGASHALRPRRPTVQMLDKSGVATLLRLMFIFQAGSLRTTLHNVLQNVSLNKQNRAEVISTLLHVLQDGSADMTAVERSFAHLSLKAKQPKDKDPKTPTQPLRKSVSGLGTLAHTNSEASPLMVVQQCLAALVHLAGVNGHVPSFFLTEHEPSGGLKRSLSRKGKGKDTKAAKYALNSLLSLLDRELIMESSTIMEQLSLLLNIVTSPLIVLERKHQEALEEAEKAKAETVTANDTAAAITSPEMATTEQSPVVDQASEQATDSTAPISAPVNAEASEPPTTAVTESAKEGAPKEEKKVRIFNPPVVPDHNLRLVTNIFCCECNSKTFRETISTIKNLSTIPGAKAVFGKELISKAQALGEVILKDLEELLPQIQKAQTGTEIQGVALAKFSPPASDQHKLLRVLTALDHLFDPKREKKNKPDEESSQLEEKQDLLATLYENSTFGPMWEKLSACLSTIRQRDHMLSVATILLPLIESLMVVCKNTTLKDAPLSSTQKNKELTLTSPPPENRMESLFFTFTEEHRKILNDLVRHNPKLMSGTFSLLVKNPKVLEFDNKRNYFTRSIHNRTQTRQSFPPLQLAVRRDQVFHDSFKSLYFQTGDQMKYGKLSIRFHGEEGVDAGGVTREWFQVLSRQMFDPGYALFIPVSSDRTTFHPNQLSSINEEHLMFFKFIGRIIGKALYEGRVLDCHFSRAVYKRILGKAVSVKDMESLDPDYYKSLIWLLENDITDIITETFSVDNDKFGVVETIDFIENGRNIPVTEENKQEYVRLMVEWKLTGSVKEQLDEFLKGFHDIIPAELIAIFNEQELELLISGLPEIDVDDWKSNTEYHNYTASSPQIQWFWRAVRSYDKEERAKLLQFVTGTSKVPLNGFKELEGMNGFSRFNIHRDYGNKDRLPSSHTCFNQLDLPEYESYEALRSQVLTAITAGSEYFGFA